MLLTSRYTVHSGRAVLLGLPGVLLLPLVLPAPEGVSPAALVVNPLILLILASLSGAWAAPTVGLASFLVLMGRREAPSMARWKAFADAGAVADHGA
jgi:hypothetical protein